jgi:hypothetical protein
MDDGVSARIEAANQGALGVIVNAQPTWVDVVPAREFIPGFTENLILFSGPPLDPRRALKPVRTAISGAAVHEGLAKGLDAAWQMVLGGEIVVAPALDHLSAGGAALPVTASMPVQVVEDPVTKSRACCAIQEGASNEALRWGLYTPVVASRLTWFKQELGPVLGELVRAMGGLNLRNIVARGIGMGDENHSRQLASNSLALVQIMPHLMDLAIDHRTRSEVVKFLCGAERFFLHLFVAGAAAVMQAVKGIDYCTLLVAMGGNGCEFGMKFSFSGDRWYTTAAPKCLGMVLNPTWTDEDVCPYLGDSSAVEVYGFGGLAAAAGPMVVRLAGGDFREAVRRTQEAREVCVGSHDWAPIPWLDFQGPPVGVDLRKVVATGITPTSHGGTTHREGGQAGAGSCHLPMACFTQALHAFARQYGL